MRVYFVATDRGGSGRWRSSWPAWCLEDAGYQTDVEIAEGWFRTHRPTPEDVVISHRPEFGHAKDYEEWLPVQRRLQRDGVPVYIDEDDDITCLPKTFDQRVRTIARERIVGHHQAIREADGLIVSTPRLVEVYGHLAKRTWVKPNLIADWVQHCTAPLEPNKVKVGWAGITRTHLHDLQWIAPQIGPMLEGATFYSVGDLLTPRWLGLKNAETKPTIHDPSVFYREMSKADIGIVPLNPDETLNQAKSYIKALEYMTFGRPVVATRLPEQERLIIHGTTGFLADTPEEFAAYVQVLVHDEDLRLRMGRAGKDSASEYTLSVKGQQWVDLMAEIDVREKVPA